MADKQKKRILYLRTDIGTQNLIGGGSATHTLGVLKAFDMLNFYVVCASTAMHTLLQKRQLIFVPLAVPHLLQRLSFKLSCLVSNILFYFKLKKIIRVHKITLIYQRYSMLNCVGVALAHRFGIPLYLEYNGSEYWVDQHWSPRRRLRFDRLIEKIELLNVRHAEKIIVVSHVLKDQLCARGIESRKILVCPNGVDPDMFDADSLQSQREQVRTKLSLQDRFVFGFSGTFGPWHGIDLLAYMIPRVVRQHEQAYFLLIGDGVLKQKLYDALKEKQVLHRVLFTGMVPNDQVPAYLAMCDAFLCPTQRNPDGTPFFGSPTKLFEYMMIGKPIIASDIGQIGQVLRHDIDRLLIDPDDYEGFVHAALDLLHMPADERMRLGDLLRKRALKDHTWRAHVQSFM